VCPHILWNARLKLLEYIQFREIGLGLVEVVEILPAPAEGLTVCPLDTAGIDATSLQDGFVFGLKSSPTTATMRTWVK